MSFEEGKIKYGCSMDIDLEKDHLETPPGKDFPKLSTSPGSASAAETKFSRVYD